MIELLKICTELTGVGLAGVIVVVGYLLGRLVVSLGRNHLEHMQRSYDRLAESCDRTASAQEAQTELLRAQNEALAVNTKTLQALHDLIERERERRP